MNLRKTWKTLRNKQQGCKNVSEIMRLQSKSFVIAKQELES